MSRSVRQMTHRELLKSLLILDDVLLTMVAADSKLYLMWEKRLRDSLLKLFHRTGRAIVKETETYLKRTGVKKFRQKDVKKIDEIAQRHFDRLVEDPKLNDSFEIIIEEAYSRSKLLALQRVFGDRDKLPIDTIRRDRTVHRAVSKSIDIASADDDSVYELLQKQVKPSLAAMSRADRQAIEALASQYQTFWFGTRLYGDIFEQLLVETARKDLIESGLDGIAAIDATKDSIRGVLGLEPVPPPGFKGHPDDYFANLAGNVVTTARAHGTIRAFDAVGVDRYVVTNPEDERTCPICNRMVTEAFSVSVAAEQIGKQVAAKTPDEVKRIQPWLGWKKIRDIPSDRLQARGQSMPPFHYGCRCSVDVADDFEITLSKFTQCVATVFLDKAA